MSPSTGVNMHTQLPKRVQRQCFIQTASPVWTALITVFILFYFLLLPVWSCCRLLWCETLGSSPLCTLSGLDVLCIIFYLNLYEYVNGFYTVKCVFIVNIKINEIERLTPELLAFPLPWYNSFACSVFNEPHDSYCAYNLILTDLQTIGISCTKYATHAAVVYTHFNFL